jgi:UMF1 family MFS transporter
VKPPSSIERACWCLFDFANSAFPTIAITAFGAPYFAEVLIGPDGVDVGPLHLGGTGAWAASVSLSMIAVTITSPVMGAIADRGRKRELLALYVAVCVASTAGLGLLPPRSGLLAMALFMIANVAFEGAYVFYNAFLPELVPRDRIGRLSGAGWALGYVGGLLALALVRPIVPDDFDAEGASRGSLVYFVIAAWYLVFSLPTLLVVRDRAVLRGPIDPGGALRQVWRTLEGLRHDRSLALFLLAYLLYTDALDTTIHFTGIYTREVLAFRPGDLIVLFLVLNVIAGPGALASGVLVDRIGAKRTILITLVLWCGVIVLALLARDRASFWPSAIVAALVIGATQAGSRALMARLAPRERVAELMGFLALSGRASAAFGPLVYGGVAGALADPAAPGAGHRMALLAVGALFPIAFLVLWRVDDTSR